MRLGELLGSQDWFILHDYFEMVIRFQEGLGVFNDMSEVFKLGTVGDNQRDSDCNGPDKTQGKVDFEIKPHGVLEIKTTNLNCSMKQFGSCGSLPIAGFCLTLGEVSK